MEVTQQPKVKQNLSLDEGSVCSFLREKSINVWIYKTLGGLFIFEPFFQGEDNMSIGSGLGLPLSKKLIQLHHGDITVQSILGKGSRFIVVLPLGRAHFRADQLLDIYTERFVEDRC